MVRHHVAQRAGCVVEAAAVADAELFVDGDLHVIDVVAIPDRLEHAVGEAQHQDVLHRLLAEIVIDPVDLVLGEEFEQLRIQCLRGFEIGAERLFHHQPPPCGAVFFLQEADPAELARNRRERIGRRGEVEQAVAAGASRGFQFQELFFQPIERRGIAGIGLNRGDTFEQALGNRVHDRTGREFPQALHQALAQRGVRQRLAGNADHAEFFRQKAACGEIVERGDDEAVRRRRIRVSFA